MNFLNKNNSDSKPTAQDYQNNAKLRMQVDFYITEEGYRCFTESFHLKRGHCCQSGCRHCPYGYDKKTGQISKKH